MEKIAAADVAITRAVQTLVLGPFEIFLLHYYVPFGASTGRLDKCSGVFGWRGMVCFSLPLTAVLLWQTHETPSSAFCFVLLSLALAQTVSRVAKKKVKTL